MTTHLSDADTDSVVKVLKALALLPEKNENDEKGQASKSAIEDFSLELTKQTKSLITWATAGGAGSTLLAGLWAGLKDQGPIVLSSLIIAAAVVIAAGVTALARVADGDVRGRSAAATAVIETRGRVATVLVELYGRAPTAPKPVAESSSTTPTEAQLLAALGRFHDLKVKTDAGEFAVTHARWLNKQRQLELKLDGGDWVRMEEIHSFT